MCFLHANKTNMFKCCDTIQFIEQHEEVASLSFHMPKVHVRHAGCLLQYCLSYAMMNIHEAKMTI